MLQPTGIGIRYLNITSVLTTTPPTVEEFDRLKASRHSLISIQRVGYNATVRLQAQGFATISSFMIVTATYRKISR